LRETFETFEGPGPEQRELVAIVESTREAIVVAPFEAAAAAASGQERAG
jgi:hypothetical protein